MMGLPSTKLLESCDFDFATPSTSEPDYFHRCVLGRLYTACRCVAHLILENIHVTNFSIVNLLAVNFGFGTMTYDRQYMR